MSTRGGVVLSDVHIDVGGDVEVKLTKGHDLELGLSWDCKFTPAGSFSLAPSFLTLLTQTSFSR